MPEGGMVTLACHLTLLSKPVSVPFVNKLWRVKGVRRLTQSEYMSNTERKQILSAVQGGDINKEMFDQLQSWVNAHPQDVELKNYLNQYQQKFTGIGSTGSSSQTGGSSGSTSQ